VVVIDYDSFDTELGKRIVGELMSRLDHVYSEKVELKREKLETSIQLLRNSILNAKNQKITIKNQKARVLNGKETILNSKKQISDNIELAGKKLALLKETEKNLLQQRIEVDKNTKTILEERSATLRDGVKKDAVSLLLYSNTIQQNIGYLDRLNSQTDKNRLDQEIVLNDMRKMKIELKDKDTELRNLDVSLKDKDVDLKNVDIMVRDIEQKIGKLEIDKKEMESIHVIQQPTASFHPVKPKKKMIVALAGVIGLMGAIFLAFFMEFIDKHRGQLRKENV